MKQNKLEPGTIYHIFNRGNNRENIFKENENYEYFLIKMFFHLKSKCDFYAYCLMPNHFHILLRINETPLSADGKESKTHQPFANLFNSYTKSINKRFERSGSLFQEHMHREAIFTDDYFRKAFVYIHSNPVHHGFVANFRDYKWSSIHDYLNDCHKHMSMEFPLLLFDGIENMIAEHDRKNDLLLEF